MTYRPPTIREQGLKQYLGNESYTKFLYHYKYQSLLVEGTKKHINATAVANALGIHPATAREYITIHEEEQNKQKDGNNAEVQSTSYDKA